MDQKNNKQNLMEKITALCKRRGFIFPGSEIYGGITGFWDYGPLGAELKKNIKNEWWKNMVYQRDDVIGIDASIIMNPEVWQASGHLEAFSDPLVECRNCHTRFRTDSLIDKPNNMEAVRDEWHIFSKKILDVAEAIHYKAKKFLGVTKELIGKYLQEKDEERKNRLALIIENLLDQIERDYDEFDEKIGLHKAFRKELYNSIKKYGLVIQTYLNRYKYCPVCGKMDWATPKMFNLMTEVLLGVTEPKQKAYLRGEITQGVFVNFKNVVDSTRIKLPFGIAQIGKAFRNEITPGNFTFRSREFEQMELEFFVKPEDKEGNKWFEYWKSKRLDWYLSLGMKKENLRFRAHKDEERAHYAKFAEDIEYNAPFGWSEFEGIHHRGDWDLKAHRLTYKEEGGGEFTPWVVETSGGVDRSALFFLIDAYCEEEKRIVLKLNPKLAPIKVAVFPLLANKLPLAKLAKNIYINLKQRIQGVVAFDDRGNIGKRYYSQDEIGTPFCVTVDFQSLEDKTVTVRDRDTTKQERVKVENLGQFLNKKLS